MPEAKELAKFLSEYDDTHPNLPKEDHDLGKVLRFCNGNNLTKHKVRYSDRKEHNLSFEKNI